MALGVAGESHRGEFGETLWQWTAALVWFR